VSGTFLQFCVFVRSCCIGDLRFFRTGIFFDRAFSSDFVYFCRIADFLLSHNAKQSFLQLCVIFMCFFCVCSISPSSCLCAFTSAAHLRSFASDQTHDKIHKQIKRIITPQRHHLSSCCFMPCVSALANLSTPLSRRGAFLYSGHISALMFCAFLLRNSQ